MIKKRSIIIAIIFLGAFTLIMALFLILRTNSAIAESICENVSQKLLLAFSTINSKISVSVFELLLLTLIVVLSAFIITSIVLFCKKKPLVVLFVFLIIGSVAMGSADLYVLASGFSYNRSHAEIPMSEENPDYKEFYEITQYFKDDFDYVSNKMERDEEFQVICPYTFSELQDLIANETSRLGDYYYSIKPLAKKFLIFEDFFTSSGITGLTFGLTGECMVNVAIPYSYIPATLAHEYAHFLGAMREDEANLIAAYILITSENEYLRYCGYFNYYGYMLNALSYNYVGDDYAALYYSADVQKEITYQRDFWAMHESWWDKVSDFFNDLHLKWSGEKDGSSSYYQDTSGSDTEVHNPSTDKPVVEVTYNDFQKMFINTYYLEKEKQE